MPNPDYNLIYDATHPYINNVLLAFPPPRPDDMGDFTYVQTRRAGSRYIILSPDRQYHAGAGAASRPRLGPVETELLYFIEEDKGINVLVLVGDLGCGKSTTLRYLLHHFLPLGGGSVHYLDFDAFLPGHHGPVPEQSLLDVPTGQPADSLSYDHQFVIRLADFASTQLDDGEEIREMWSWALSLQEASWEHSATFVLHRARENLKAAGGGRLGALESDALIECRREERRKIVDASHLETQLAYACLRLDYLVTRRFQGDARKMVLIFDNVDPLPSAYHARVMDLAYRLGQQAHCKIVLALRPLTYASSGAYVFHHVMHPGPAIDELLDLRFHQCVFDLDDTQLSRALVHAFVAATEAASGRRVERRSNVPGVSYDGIFVPFLCIRAWLRAVHAILLGQGNGASAHELRVFPRAGHVLRGVCGYSVRQAKLLALKVCQSRHIPVCDVVGGTWSPQIDRDVRMCQEPITEHLIQHVGPSPGAGRPLHHREVIRAMLLWSREQFKSHPRRTFDNLYSSGGRGPAGLTCKSRILHCLASGREDTVFALSEVRSWTNLFMYEEPVLLAALNALISIHRRLVWCDCVVEFRSPLSSYVDAKLALAPAGRYYLDCLSFNTTYVQEMIADSDANMAQTAEYRDLVGRARDLRRFLTEIFKRDVEEVDGILYQGAASAVRYKQVYGSVLFTERVIHVARENVAAQLSEGRIAAWAAQLQQNARDELANWDNFLVTRTLEPDAARIREQLDKYRV